MCSSIHVWGEPDSWTRSIDANRSFDFRNSSFRKCEIRLFEIRVFDVSTFEFRTSCLSLFIFGFRMTSHRISEFRNPKFAFETNRIFHFELRMCEIYKSYCLKFECVTYRFSKLELRSFMSFSELRICKFQIWSSSLRSFDLNFGTRGFDFRNSHLP